MSHQFLLGAQVVGVVGVGRNHNRNSPNDLNARSAQGGHFIGVIGHEFHLPDTQVFEHRDGRFVLAGIGVETEVGIGVNRVETLILQVVRFEFIDQANTAPFLPEVNHHAASFGGNAQGRVQLFATIAAAGPKYVARHTFGVNPDRHGVIGDKMFADKSNVRHGVFVVGGVSAHIKRAVSGRDARACLELYRRPKPYVRIFKVQHCNGDYRMRYLPKGIVRALVLPQNGNKGTLFS